MQMYEKAQEMAPWVVFAVFAAALTFSIWLQCRRISHTANKILEDIEKVEKALGKK